MVHLVPLPHHTLPLRPLHSVDQLDFDHPLPPEQLLYQPNFVELRPDFVELKLNSEQVSLFL